MLFIILFISCKLIARDSIRVRLNYTGRMIHGYIEKGHVLAGSFFLSPFLLSFLPPSLPSFLSFPPLPCLPPSLSLSLFHTHICTQISEAIVDNFLDPLVYYSLQNADILLLPFSVIRGNSSIKRNFPSSTIRLPNGLVNMEMVGKCPMLSFIHQLSHK